MIKITENHRKENIYVNISFKLIIKKKKLIRLLPNVIARRVIIASHKHASTTKTYNSSTPNSSGSSPHNLCIMPTLLSSAARIGPIIIPPSFPYPCSCCLTWTPLIATSPKYVLPVCSIGVLQCTVPTPLISIPLRVTCQFRIPHQRKHS